jgi:hypothetical protein
MEALEMLPDKHSFRVQENERRMEPMKHVEYCRVQRVDLGSVFYYPQFTASGDYRHDTV